MKIVKCQHELAAALVRTRSAAHPNTPLEREAFAIIEMAMAYQKDGTVFYNKGDLVNALAAFWYGTGWLHFGISSGLLNCEDKNPFCPFAGSLEKLSLSLTEKLQEKPFATIVCLTQPDPRWNVQESLRLSVIILPVRFFSSLRSMQHKAPGTAKPGQMKMHLPASVTGMAGWMPVLCVDTSASWRTGISSRCKGT